MLYGAFKDLAIEIVSQCREVLALMSCKIACKKLNEGPDRVLYKVEAFKADNSAVIFEI